MKPHQRKDNAPPQFATELDVEAYPQTFNSDESVEVYIRNLFLERVEKDIERMYEIHFMQ